MLHIVGISIARYQINSENSDDAPILVAAGYRVGFDNVSFQRPTTKRKPITDVGLQCGHIENCLRPTSSDQCKQQSRFNRLRMRWSPFIKSYHFPGTEMHWTS